MPFALYLPSRHEWHLSSNSLSRQPMAEITTYTVKKVIVFPVLSRDVSVTNQTLPGWE
jgi:hypothetical protein